MSISLHHAILMTCNAQKNSLRPGMVELGLSPGQPKVLRFLAAHDSCMQKEIAEALNIEPATVSRLLFNMEQNGLVVRSTPEECRRAESVSITEEGRVAFAGWEEVCHTVEGQSLQGFSEEEKLQFMKSLSWMYQNLTGKPLE
jgi:MarR family transcriptional regulator, organic hydroperoxide resistance regulator